MPLMYPRCANSMTEIIGSNCQEDRFLRRASTDCASNQRCSKSSYHLQLFDCSRVSFIAKLTRQQQKSWIALVSALTLVYQARHRSLASRTYGAHHCTVWKLSSSPSLLSSSRVLLDETALVSFFAMHYHFEVHSAAQLVPFPKAERSVFWPDAPSFLKQWKEYR